MTSVYAVLAIVVSTFAALFGAAKWGMGRERDKSKLRDHGRAQTVRDRADEALRKNDGDTRPVDSRLRETGRLRD